MATMIRTLMAIVVAALVVGLVVDRAVTCGGDGGLSKHAALASCWGLKQ